MRSGKGRHSGRSWGFSSEGRRQAVLSVELCCKVDSYTSCKSHRFKRTGYHYPTNLMEPHRISVCGNLATTAIMFLPHSLKLYRAILTIPNSVVTNAMACKILRYIKFRKDQKATQPSLPTIQCHAPALQTTLSHPECPSADLSLGLASSR